MSADDAVALFDRLAAEYDFGPGSFELVTCILALEFVVEPAGVEYP